MVESAVQSHAEIVVGSDEKKLIRVLHVDDELGLLKVAKQCLEMQGPFHVDTAGSVEEALNKLKEKEYDAVVSDYQMPGKDGLEFLEMLRKNGNTIPFIMFTGKGREEVAVKAWSLGADHYVNKAGDPETVYCELAHCLRSTMEKRFAEAQIKETVQRLQTIYQNAVEGISYVDAEENIVFANKAFADIIGYEPDQLEGMNLRRIVDDENWARIGCETKRRRQGESSRYEAEFRRSDGTVRNVMISGAPLLDHDRRFAGTVGIVLDITERKKTEEALRQSEEKYRNLFENAKDVIILLDLKGNVISANKGAEKYGFNKNGMLGKNMLKFVSKRYWPKLLKDIAQIALGKTAEGRIEIHTPKGDKIAEYRSNPIFSDNRVAGIQTVLEDTTERKKAEEALKESEERFRSMVESTSDWIWQVDKNGVFTYASPKTKDILGYEPEEVVGKTPFDLMPEDEAKRIAKFFGEIAEKKESFHGLENWNVHKNGNRMLLETSGVPILDEKRNLIGYRGIGRDVTERKQWEDASRDAKEKWASLTENTDDIVMIVDGNGVIQYINRTIPPYTPEETIGKTVYEYIPREQHNVMEKSLREVFKTGKPGSYQVSSNIAKIGAIWFSTKVVPIKHDGKVSSAILISSNITDRKKAEEELRNSEERLSVLFELAPDAYYLNDLKGNFIDGNKAAEEVTGYMKNELIGKSFLKLKLLPRNEALKAAKLLAMNALGKSTGPDEFVLNRKDGTQVPVEIRTYPVKIKDKTVVLGIARDITIRKKDEQVIRESHQKFEGLFRHNPEAAVYLDVNFKIRDVNPRFCHLFGYSAKEVEGRSINEVVVPEGMREEAESLDKDAKNGYATHDTVRKRKDGSLVHVSISAAPATFENNLLGYVEIYKDITELKRAQEESEESRRHFQMLFDLMADPVAVVDERGKILEVTQKVEEITGFKKEEVVGKNLLKVKMFGAKTKAVMIKSLAKRMMGMHVEPYEVEVRKKDGGKLMYEINAAKIDYKGKPADLVVFRDVLERKKLEEKLRVVGRLTRHDVRNKLCAVTGNAYLLKRKLAGNPEALEQLVDMENAVRNVEAIFEFARTYEKLGVEQLVNVNVGKAVDEAVSLFPDLKGIRIANECGGLTVLADSLLRQLFYNLIDDSLKYGEKLTQIRIRYEKSENQLKLVYEDDGVGISKDAKPKLFSEGYTTGKGSGYGLYLIRRMMEVYGWTIQETGTPGNGVCFTVVIPEKNQDGKENYQLH
jgi:PAS domain S-box-containing protein